MKIILGPPGCGKTTRLLSIVDEYLAKGIAPERIAFVSFSKKAATEAAERAAKKFGFSTGQLTYFRTIHSLAFQALGITKDMVMARSHYDEIGKLLGIEFSNTRMDIEEGLPVGSGVGDRLLFIDNFARTRCMDLKEAYYYIRDDNVSFMALDQFSRTLTEYKKDNGLIDFTDMLMLYTKECGSVDVDVAIVDEAQDLSTLQWQVINHAFGHVKNKFIAGDDDQAIYKWAGADVDMFLNLKGEQEVLSQSYRLPLHVYRAANKISDRIKKRYPKRWSPRNEAGMVQHIPDLNLDFSEGSWLLLVRNNYLAKNIGAQLRVAGIPFMNGNWNSIKAANLKAILAWEHLRKGEGLSPVQVKQVYSMLKIGSGVTRGFKSCKGLNADEDYYLGELKNKYGLLTERPWHEALEMIPLSDRAYYLSILRNGYKISQPPQVKLSTIHGVKGGEADNVVLFTDMSWRTHSEYMNKQDDEHRVFYVGATRAKQNLHIATLGQRYQYDLIL